MPTGPRRVGRKLPGIGQGRKQGGGLLGHEILGLFEEDDIGGPFGAESRRNAARGR